MVDYLCDMGAFSKSIFTHVYIGFNISEPPMSRFASLSQPQCLKINSVLIYANITIKETKRI